jgi:pilus assembly protein CpaF
VSEAIPPASTVDRATIDGVRADLAAERAEPTAANLAAALRRHQWMLGHGVILDLVGALHSELAGAGPLEVLLREPGVSDVLVNGTGHVWVDRGRGVEPTDVRFTDGESVRLLATRLAAAAGRRLDDATPYVDVRMADGTRLHAVLPPIAADGTCVSLRVPARRELSLPDLVRAGSVPSRGARWLEAIVQARLACLVTGGTGSGKTTLLSALLSLADPRERLVLVEDSAELRPAHPHVVRLEARPPNVEGAGEVTVRDLVRQALRMRPDRLIVGEARGAEVVDLLAALNTGHEGGCGTLHANSPADVPARLEALAVTGGLPRPAVHSQIAAGLHAVVHVTRGHDGTRRVSEIGVVVREPDGLVRIGCAIRMSSGPTSPGRTVAGPAFGVLRSRLAGNVAGSTDADDSAR